MSLSLRDAMKRLRRYETTISFVERAVELMRSEGAVR
jgi:hypothetical protein